MSKRAELSEVQRTEDVDSLLRFGVKAFICELTKENQRVSNSVFSVSSYIRYKRLLDSYACLNQSRGNMKKEQLFLHAK